MFKDLRPLVCVSFAASLLILRFVRRPFIWIDFLLAALCFWVGYRRQPARFVLANVATALATLALSEAWFAHAVRPHTVRFVEEPPGASYEVQDPLIGETARPNVRAIHIQTNPDGSEIFRAKYRIDGRGLRVTPERASVPAIVFFGCSFTFGEGVDDDASMPYRVGLLQPAYRAYNFGFHGYGPHQMLASIEGGRMERVVATPPRFVIFQMIVDHVRRVANHVRFPLHAPAYGIVDGQVRLLGHFDDVRPSLILRRVLRKSALYSEAIEPHMLTNADAELTVAIVNRARELIRERFPDCEFHVLFWEMPDYWLSHKLLKELQRGTLQVHLVRNILAGYPAAAEKYLFPGDGHPNAKAHDLIARYVSSQIIGQGEKQRETGQESISEGNPDVRPGDTKTQTRPGRTEAIIQSDPAVSASCAKMGLRHETV